MNIIILCNASLNAFDVKVFDSLFQTSELEVKGVLVNTIMQSGLEKVKSEWKKGRGLFILVIIFRSIFRKLFRPDSRPSLHYRKYSKFNALPVRETTDLYDKGTSDWLSGFDADIILLRGFGIIREPVLSMYPFGVLSYHHGDMKKYRGGPPAFWELFNNEPEIGVTLQVLNEGIDTGTIILQRFFKILQNDTWQVLRIRIYEGSETMAAEGLVWLGKNGPFRSPLPKNERGKYYTLPSLSQWAVLQFKLLRRRL
jgi:hypothetical protein